MKTKIIAIVIASVLLLATFSAIGTWALPKASLRFGTQSEGNDLKEQEPNEHKPEMPKMTALAYHDLWRKLWEDHVWWTRMVIIGVFDDLGGTGNYTARLIQNYVDMENALKPFYGDKAEELGDLIQDHLLIAANILVEAKAGHNITGLVNDWYANGNQIAMTMNELNPRFWKLDTAEDFWKMHLDLTLEEAVAHLTHDWAGDVAAFDKIHAEALKMADFFSMGVILQFPGMFTATGHVMSP